VAYCGRSRLTVRGIGLLAVLAASITAAPSANAGVLVIPLDDVVESATTVAVVRVVEYREGYMRCQPIACTRRPKVFFYDLQRSSLPAPVEYVREGAVDSPLSHYTGQWPRPGSEVLIVVDRRGGLVLFGLRGSRYWRLWSPWSSLSAVRFKGTSPARPLTGNFEDMAPSAWSSWEGCLVPDDQVTEWLK